MLLVEMTGMLYIGNHKIRFLRVLHHPRDSAKLLHLDIVYLLPTSASVFGRKIALVGRVDEDPFGGTQWPTFHIRQHRQKMQTVSSVRHVWSSFKFRQRP